MDTQSKVIELISSEFGIGAGTALFILIILSVWTLIWKGIALWKSARLAHKGWFFAILIVNTLGILEIIYIFFVAKKYKIEVEERNE